MNYLNNPNYVNNYPYNYMNQYIPQPQFIPQPTQTPQIQQQQSLNGKIVDSADVVKATEVPIGGYGIFPKADLSEIYIKSWNNNGTTSIITFKPIVPEPQIQQQNENLSNLLLQKIEILENKLDKILIPEQQTKKTEVIKNEF